jgi:phosphate transport system permease protein
MKPQNKERVVFSLLGIPTMICLLVFGWIIYILSTGIGTLSWRYLTTSVLRGGIFEMIIGTLYLLLGAAGVSGPIGIFAAIYLVEYAPRGRFTRIIDQAINNLAGVPSIVIGLFGYTFFSRQLGLGRSLAAGWLTLAIMMLPIVIRGSEEAIRMIPSSFKEAALALGASKWKAISSTTLRAAIPGVLTSVILGIARIAGETAAILFVASVGITRGLPKSPFEPVMALAYNLYVNIVVLRSPTQRVLGIALVLFLLVASLSLVAIVLRIYFRRKQPWLR